MPRGGARPGSGRKPKDRTPQGHFESAEAYLEAIVKGDIAPDALRIQAAKSLLAYQAPKKRVKVKSPPPAEIRRKEISSIEQATLSDFEEKAAQIRAKLGRSR